jgi:hypothetical protein
MWNRIKIIPRTLAPLGISFCFFTILPNIVIQYEIVNDFEGLKKFFEYIGLFFLLIAGWQLRKIFDFDSLGGISKHPEISPTNPANRKFGEGDTPPESAIIPLDKIVYKINFEKTHKNIHQERAIEILELMRENPNSIITLPIISSKLSMPRQTAERYLFELMKKKLVRKDTYPGSRGSIYSLSASLDNLVIDYFIKTHLKSEEVIINYRYIKLKDRHEIDALIKTTKTNYVVEIKYVSETSAYIISKGLEQLLIVEEEINIEPVSLVLLLVGSVDSLERIEVENFQFKDNLEVVLIKENEISNSL